MGGGRAKWKGIFCDASVISKVLRGSVEKPVRIYSRRSTILHEFIGYKFEIHNGRSFVPLTVSIGMVGHKFGEFSMTRTVNEFLTGRKKLAGQKPEEQEEMKLLMTQTDNEVVMSEEEKVEHEGKRVMQSLMQEAKNANKKKGVAKKTNAPNTKGSPKTL